MSAEKARLTWRGNSYDGRTNRWSVECPHCKKTFLPPTTRLGKQLLTCPAGKCRKEMLADYNGELDRLNTLDTES